MSFVQLLGTFRAYGADVLLLALGVTLTVSLLKKTVMKNVPKKVFVFLPFAVGAVYYAVFRAAVTASAAPFTTEISRTLEGGFACGCAATLYYTVYEQFFRGKNISPLYALLAGIVPEEKREEAASALFEGYFEKKEEERKIFLQEGLKTYCGDTMSEEELIKIVEFLIRFLDTLEKK